MKHTGKYYLPGGAVEKGETITEALKREMYEETGIIAEDESFLAFKEIFFYHDPLNEAYHVLAFFYKTSPKSIAINGEHLLEGEEAATPCWIDLSSIASIDLQDDREVIIESVNQIMLPLPFLLIIRFHKEIQIGISYSTTRNNIPLGIAQQELLIFPFHLLDHLFLMGYPYSFSLLNC